MATNYPGAKDTWDDPAMSTLMNAPGFDHTAAHGNVQDAVEAIETFVGTSGSPGPALTPYATTEQLAAYAPLAADNSWAGLQTINLSGHAAGGTAGVYIENQGNGRYGLAIASGGSSFNAVYINYQNAADGDHAIGIDAGGGATGGILIACHTAIPGLTISGTATNLAEFKDGGGVSRFRVNTSGDLLETASNTGLRFYSDGYGTTVAEIKVDATDAGLGNFFNRGIRSKDYGATVPTTSQMLYGGEIALGEQSGTSYIYVNQGGAIKKVAVA